MSAASFPRATWQRLLPAVGRRPAIYLPFSRWRYGRELPFGAGTEIVIEGFPRSGNSFAVNAFSLAQARPVRIAHHLHAPAQIMAAARADVPAIVLIREPWDAITSYLLWQSHVDARRACRNYLSFYGSLRGYKVSLVVADFEQVTTDFGSVIERVNQRFGTTFAPFHHSDANVRKCFHNIDRDSRARQGVLDESVVARPSRARDALKQDAQSELVRSTDRATRLRLDSVYAEFRALSTDAATPRADGTSHEPDQPG